MIGRKIANSRANENRGALHDHGLDWKFSVWCVGRVRRAYGRCSSDKPPVLSPSCRQVRLCPSARQCGIPGEFEAHVARTVRTNQKTAYSNQKTGRNLCICNEGVDHEKTDQLKKSNWRNCLTKAKITDRQIFFELTGSKSSDVSAQSSFIEARCITSVGWPSPRGCTHRRKNLQCPREAGRYIRRLQLLSSKASLLCTRDFHERTAVARTRSWRRRAPAEESYSSRHRSPTVSLSSRENVVSLVSPTCCESSGTATPTSSFCASAGCRSSRPHVLNVDTRRKTSLTGASNVKLSS